MHSGQNGRAEHGHPCHHACGCATIAIHATIAICQAEWCVLSAMAAMAHATAEAGQIVEALHEAQMKAIDDVAAARLLEDEGSPEAKDCIVFASMLLAIVGGSLELAGHAFAAMSRAKASAQNTPSSRLCDALKTAEMSVRDYLIWRVQMKTPLTDRAMFMKLLREAVGNTLFDDPNVHSHLMHSHSREVCSRFPNAFLSNAKREGLKRGHARTSRPRPARPSDGAAVRPPPGLEAACPLNLNEMD